MVQTAFLLVAACWLCTCFSTAPPSARRGRAESHQWTRAAVAFPTSARSRYKPAHTDRRSLWMSPPSHKALRAPTTTAPPNTKSPVPRSSAERVVSLVDGRPPMRPRAPSPLAPGSQPCPRRIAVRHRIRSAMRDAPGGGNPPPGAVVWSARSFRPLPRERRTPKSPRRPWSQAAPRPGGTAVEALDIVGGELSRAPTRGNCPQPAMRCAPGGRMPWGPGPAPARGRHLAS